MSASTKNSSDTDESRRNVLDDSMKLLANNQLRKFKRYPAYKDSGIEWLGEIPAHWDVKRSDAFLRYEKLQVEPSDFGDGLVFHYSIPSIQSTGDGQFEPPSSIDSAKLRILGNRLLVSKLNPRKGVVLIASEKNVPTICSTELVPFDVLACDIRWSLYLFLGESTRQRLSAVVRSATRSHQRAEIADLVKLWHGVPSIVEQHTIATFLDRETKKIDALVAKKERLIELLREKHTALISCAVTKGLDPRDPMKNSSVEWLGSIPARWTAKRVRQVCSRLTDGAHISPDTSTADFPFVSTVDIRNGMIDFDGCLRTSAVSYAYMDRTGCCPKQGDVLFSKDGTVGTTAIVTASREFAVASSLVILQPNQREVDSRWLDYWLNGAFVRDHVELLLSGAALRRISVAKVGRLPIVLPLELDEQRSIADFLDRETLRIALLIAKIRDAICCLKELRICLISAAVTGKVDVRDAVT